MITAKTAFSAANSNNTGPFGFPETVLPKVQALPDVAGRRRLAHRPGDPPRRPERQGDLERRRAEPRLQPRRRTATSGSTRSRSSRAAGRPAPHEVAIDKATADKKDYKVGDTIGVQVRGPVAAVPDRGDRRARRRLLDRRRHARDLRPADRPAAVRQGGQARPDPRRREAGRADRRSSCPRSGRSCRRPRR